MKTGEYFFPDGYLDQPDTIPSFWVATNSEINLFLKTKVSKGKVERIGTSSGGRPVMAVMYGEPRKGNGTTTFSGACGINNIAPYRGPDNEKTVYVGLGGVHGYETEGIMGVVNFMHDDFFGDLQPENQALFDLVAREKPDIIINMHTGAPGNNYFMRMHRPMCEPVPDPVYDP